MKTGEVFDAKSIDVPDEITMTLPDGTQKKVKKSDIQSIHLHRPKQFRTDEGKRPATEAEIQAAIDEFKVKQPYETPKQTFLTWRAHAEEGDINGMVDCYASFRQSTVKKNLKKIKRKEREEMKQTMQLTSFVAQDPIYQGEKAFMEVTWSKGLYAENQVLKFILEDDQWKIIE